MTYWVCKLQTARVWQQDTMAFEKFSKCYLFLNFNCIVLLLVLITTRSVLSLHIRQSRFAHRPTFTSDSVKSEHSKRDQLDVLIFGVRPAYRLHNMQHSHCISHCHIARARIFVFSSCETLFSISSMNRLLITQPPRLCLCLWLQILNWFFRQNFNFRTLCQISGAY